MREALAQYSCYSLLKNQPLLHSAGESREIAQPVSFALPLLATNRLVAILRLPRSILLWNRVMSRTEPEAPRRMVDWPTHPDPISRSVSLARTSNTQFLTVSMRTS